MLSTQAMARLTKFSKEAEAKLIYVGDEMQLASLEAGGIFGTIKDRIKAIGEIAVLKDVWRINKAAPMAIQQKEAFNAMHARDFKAALKVFDELKAIRWSTEREQTMLNLVADYIADEQADQNPNSIRMIFAYTNSEAKALNEMIRWEKQKLGTIGEKVKLNVRDNVESIVRPTEYAVGDRIQFRANGKTEEMRQAGFVNGAFGYIRNIEGNVMTVELDKMTNGKRDVVTFAVGENADNGEYNCFKLGFASTIYSGQGKSITHSYVLFSNLWRAPSSYVALSRHEHTTKLYVTDQYGEPWMMRSGGMAGLNDEHLLAASRAHKAWMARHPSFGKRHDLESYINFVQSKWAEENKQDGNKLERLAKKMAREDENRSALAFHYDEAELAEPVTKSKLQQWISYLINKLKAARYGTVETAPSISPVSMKDVSKNKTEDVKSAESAERTEQAAAPETEKMLPMGDFEVEGHGLTPEELAAAEARGRAKEAANKEIFPDGVKTDYTGTPAFADPDNMRIDYSRVDADELFGYEYDYEAGMSDDAPASDAHVSKPAVVSEAENISKPRAEFPRSEINVTVAGQDSAPQQKDNARYISIADILLENALKRYADEVAKLARERDAAIKLLDEQNEIAGGLNDFEIRKKIILDKYADDMNDAVKAKEMVVNVTKGDQQGSGKNGGAANTKLPPPKKPFQPGPPHGGGMF